MSEPLTDEELAKLRALPIANRNGSTGDLVDRLLATLDARSALDVESLANDVRWGGSRDPSDYWRGFNDGIDKLTAAFAAKKDADSDDR